MQLLGRVERVRELYSQLSTEVDLKRVCEVLVDLSQYNEQVINAYDARYPAEQPLGTLLTSKREQVSSSVIKNLSFSEDGVMDQLRLLDQLGRVKEGILEYSKYIAVQAKSQFDQIDITGEMGHSKAISKIVYFANKTLVWAEVTLVKPFGVQIDLVATPLLHVVEVAFNTVITGLLSTSLDDSLYLLDLRLTELSLIFGSLEQFQSFLLSLSLDYQCSQVDRLISVYTDMETTYVRMGIQKAIQLDAISEDGLTSSCVDDAFFVARKAILRSTSMSTGLNVPSMLKDGLFPHVKAMDRRALCLRANNMLLASSLVDQLMEETTLSSDLSEYYKTSANILLTQLYRTAVKSKLSPLISAHLVNQNYSVEEETISKFNIVFTTLTTMEPFILLTEDSSVILYNIIADEICSTWKKSLLGQASNQFTHIAAFRLDHHIRATSTFFSEKNYSLKQSFTSILKLAEYLIADSRLEATDMMVMDGLTPEEQQKIIALRSDW